MAGTMAEYSDRLKREVVTLVVLVLIVDGLFIAGYFAANLVRASDLVKLIYTGLWTLITLIVVIRGLTRIRALRAGPRE
ncbi:MAG: hypothetical protein ACREL3_02995 [Gemmatimonadales bacterium]